ncbi:MAG TPA: oxidoreductase [Pseudonocardiaceae bacterium]|jgi:protochlorophyllide reductase|nr:oxidoreductase [Pseudonocardiaceae bacterium]
MSHWSETDIPDLTGRTMVVTGANSGLGLRTSAVLADRGAHVLLACRSAQRGEVALRAITERGGSAELVSLDLADLASVRAAAARIRELTGDRLDVLLNNAGVMMTPKATTKDGFELQFGSNHLGHAALTWLLMPALRGIPGSRVVTMSSLMARAGRINMADPNFTHRLYLPTSGYGQAKLANAVFATELDRRLRAAGVEVASMAAHPGYTATELTTNMARSRRGVGRTVVGIFGSMSNSFIGQSVATGALPELYAATAPDAEGGRYYGPKGFAQMYGHPTVVRFPSAARDETIGARLWELTAELTGVQPDPG